MCHTPTRCLLLGTLSLVGRHSRSPPGSKRSWAPAPAPAPAPPGARGGAPGNTAARRRSDPGRGEADVRRGGGGIGRAAVTSASTCTLLPAEDAGAAPAAAGPGAVLTEQTSDTVEAVSSGADDRVWSTAGGDKMSERVRRDRGAGQNLPVPSPIRVA